MTELTRTEKLILFSLHPEKGSIRKSSQTFLNYAVAGSLLLTLMQEGLLILEGKLLSPAQSAHHSKPMENEVLRLLSTAKRKKKLQSWVSWLPSKMKHLWKQGIAQLIQKNILREEEHKVFIFRVKRYHIRYPQLHAEIENEIFAALKLEADLTSETKTLICVASACNILPAVLPKEVRAKARQTIKHLLKEDANLKAVHNQIRAIQAATYSAAT